MPFPPPPGAPIPPPMAGLPQPPPLVGGIPVGKQPLNTTPSRTVYASNLNEQVKLDGNLFIKEDSCSSVFLILISPVTLLVLKKTLRTMFSQYGEVLDVVAYKSIRARGQAFIAFAEEESATKAIKELQHFVLYGKPMVS